MDSLSLFNLKGKTALVTGSGSGIGLAIAKGLAGAGARIILNGRNEVKLKNSEGQLKEEGYDVTSLVFDVTDSDTAGKAIPSYEDTMGQIDILINNAGVNIRGPYISFSEADWNNL